MSESKKEKMLLRMKANQELKDNFDKFNEKNNQSQEHKNPLREKNKILKPSSENKVINKPTMIEHHGFHESFFN